MSAALASVSENNANKQDWLAQAAEMRDRARVKALLAHGVNVDAATESGMTPLMYAALNGSAEIVQILLDGGAQVNAKRNDGLTAIDLASFYGQMNVVLLLLKRGADPNVKGRVQTPAETWASVRGFEEIADTLRQASDGKFASAISRRVDNRPSSQEKYQAKNSFPSGPELSKLPSEKVENILATSPASELTLVAGLKENDKDSSLPVPLDEVHQLEQAVTQSTTRGTHGAAEELKRPSTTPQFRPGQVFLEKITSSWRNLTILTLAVVIVCGGATYGMLRNEMKQSSTTKTNSVERTTPPVEHKKLNTSAVSITPNTVESGASAVAVVVKAPAVEGSEVKPEPSSRIELAYKTDSPANSTQKQRPYTFSTFSKNTHPVPTRKTAAEWSPKRGNASSIRIISSANQDSEVLSNTDSNKSKTTVESSDEPKPAPLTVSVSRERSNTSLPSTRDARVADHAVPLLSNKPKRKVIQWP